MNSALNFGDCGPTWAGSVTATSMQSRLGPSDYHLFGPMKKMLSGQKFALILKCNELFVSRLDSSQHRFVTSGIQKLVNR